MKLNIHLEQCSKGWKVTADLEDVSTETELAIAKDRIQDMCAFTLEAPGWDTSPAPTKKKYNWGRHG